MDLKNKIGLKEILAMAGCLACFVIFSIILYSSNVSVGSLVNIENYLINGMITQTAGMTTTNAIISLLAPFLVAMLAFVFLILGFAFLSSYGFRKSYSRLGLISAVSAALMLVLFGFSIPSVFLSASIIVSSVYIIPLSNTYGKELKRWAFFRTGSHSISKALLITNILITIAVFLTVFISLNYYEQSFKQELSNTMTSLLGSSSEELPPALKEEMNQKIASLLEESPIISAYVRWLPVSTAFAVFFVLEFFWSLIFSNIGGFFTDILIRVNKRIK
jgi:hypothetical protein